MASKDQSAEPDIVETFSASELEMQCREKNSKLEVQTENVKNDESNNATDKESKKYTNFLEARAKMKMSQCMPGCIFEFYGRIPETVYHPEIFNSPLEEAVYNNDMNLFTNSLKIGHKVTIRLKIGQMSCIEYAAMKGYTDILAMLLNNSVCFEMLKKYFSLHDVVDRAYLISKNKSVFFGQEALAEANRYVAALYTAIIYDRPTCVQLLLGILGPRDLSHHNFYTNGTTLEKLTAADLAKILGHTECYKMILQWLQSMCTEYSPDFNPVQAVQG